MARIRTIKPEFWSDEKLTECSLSARLLFIGTWNFADDSGNLDRSAKQIKARVFPIDNVDCEPLLNELITQGLLSEYSVNGKIYLHINGFNKHQLINRPSKPSCPQFDESLILNEDSMSTHDGREGKGKERIKAIVTVNTVDDCPHQEIINLYHEHLMELPAIKIWNDKRRSILKSRWREDENRQNLEWWGRFFKYVSKSDFLMGRATEFQATLEWLISPKNFVKVIEGNYENRKQS